jgi:hypothetical protein
MDVAVLGVMIPIIALMIPFWSIYWKSRKDRAKFDEMREARRSIERLTIEKLEVIRTAITMGYSDEELGVLDRRLEKLVGSDKLQYLLNPDPKKVPPISHELLDTDLDREVERVSRERQSKVKTQEG